MSDETQGGNASANGQRAQRLVRSLLEMAQYRKSRYTTLPALLDDHNALFAEAGRFAEQCRVPLEARYHRPGRSAVVDFVIVSRSGSPVLLSIKSQQSNGTAEQKLEYEIRQLQATERPAAMLVLGPLRGRDGESGWSPDVLGEIWERTLNDGAGRVLLFRSEEKLMRWLKDGLPLPSGATTPAAIFMNYCDREP